MSRSFVLAALLLTTTGAFAQSSPQRVPQMPPATEATNPTGGSGAQKPASDPTRTQVTPAPSATPALSDASVPPQPVRLMSGANSFTEGEARSRLEKSGYSDLQGLTKDREGIWRATARKNAATVHVGLDYKGNIAESAS